MRESNDNKNEKRPINYRLSDFDYRDELGIFIHPSDASIDYADGGERYIIDTLRAAKDLSSYSQELIDYIKDWPSRYHFSYRRNNLLEGIAELFNKDDRVLEIGSGCGIISRWLGERFIEVDAIEGSLSRTLATRARTRGLNNVNVYCGDILHTKFERKYDIATVIGVLEYLPFYDSSGVSAKATCTNFLKRLSDSMNEDGVLVLAIENKLGIKYFSGCREDHTGKEFDGISDYPEKSPVTFSRNELESILHEAGFTSIQFYHLFSDYKLTEAMIAENDEVLSLRPYNWIRTPFEDYLGERLHLTPEALLLKTLTDSRLLWHFSNSFLVLASKSNARNLKTKWLIKKFYNNEINHDRKFHHTITLTKDKSGYIVKRQPIADGRPHVDLSEVEFSLEDMEYKAGDLLSLRLYKAILSSDPRSAIKSLIGKLHDHLFHAYFTGKYDDEGYALLKGNAIDCTFWNLITPDGSKLYFIDRKWKINRDIPIDFVLFRALFHIQGSIAPFLYEKDRKAFLIESIASVCPKYSSERLNADLKLEEEFQSIVHDRKIELSIDYRPAYSVVSQVRRNNEMIDEIASLTSEIGSINGKLGESIQRTCSLESELNDLRSDSVELENQLNLSINQAQSLESKLNESIGRSQSLSVELNNFTGRAQILESELNNSISHVQALESELRGIKQSITYKATDKLQGMIDWSMPNGTRRRTAFNQGFKGIRIVVNEGPGSFLRQFREYLRTKKTSKKSLRNLKNNTSLIAPGQKDQDAHKSNAEEQGRSIDSEKYMSDLFNRAAKKSPEYALLSNDHISLTEDDVKLIAFYLPQFHPIPENDRWWGKGFTEWTNVSKAVPQFVGHYQPQLPGELGFYDLRLIEVQKRQVELARQYGIYGFCFHYYWFNGKRLLEKPLDQYLEHKELNLPFCICWANENWTKRWDGEENEVLVAQNHSEESDLKFIRDLEPYLRDPRYIRVNGKPLVIIYRAKLLPDAKKTAKLWRDYCINVGIGDIYLAGALCFGFDDPRGHGFDAALEFPPHTMPCNNITHKFNILNPKFSGNIFDYREFVKSKRYLKAAPFKLFKTVCPGWDNTARRPNNETIYWGADPGAYKEWLSNIIKFTKEVHRGDERLVFINAWNEWAEGAHLEPDRKYGYGNLQATSDAIYENRRAPDTVKKIVYVSHDAYFHGAQMLALNTVKVLAEQFHYKVHAILKSGGPLEDDFKRYSTVYNIEKDYPDDEKVEKLIDRLYGEGADIAICNTVVSGDFVKRFSERGFRTISLVHEMPELIRSYKMEGNAEAIAQLADKVVFPSGFVKEKFETITKLDDTRVVIRPQGLYFKNPFKGRKEEARVLLRKMFSIPESANVILAVAYADYRKGPDIFVHVAKKVLEATPNTYFIWVGHHDDLFMKNVLDEANRSGYKNNILFVGKRTPKEIDVFYAGADLYLMTSREDPFPSTILDSMDAGVPVVGFDEAGGFKDIVTDKTGALVPYLNADAMSAKIIELLGDKELKDRLGDNAAVLIDTDYRFVDYVYSLLGMLGHEYKKVSVIVPNYNYARYLKKRLSTIVGQDYPVYELIILDDCSSDNSVDIINDHVASSSIPVEVIFNEKNSGSVFRQWSKGIEKAKGDYIWIAEADDLSEKGFLAEVMKSFNDGQVVLSYSQSKQIDQNENIIDTDYLKYTNDIDDKKWKSDYIREGIAEICDTLAIKNTIPNVSGIVFKKYGIEEIIDKLAEFKVAGDWFFYVWLLQNGKVSFRSVSLNLHRRHLDGVTLSENVQRHYDEIVRMQDYILHRFNVDEYTREKVMYYRKRAREYLLEGEYAMPQAKKAGKATVDEDQ